MEEYLTIIFLAGGGVFTLVAAILDWDWFMNHPKARFFVGLFGRTGTRIFYALLGVFLIAVGGMLWQAQNDGRTESGLQEYGG